MMLSVGLALERSQADTARPERATSAAQAPAARSRDTGLEKLLAARAIAQTQANAAARFNIRSAGALLAAVNVEQGFRATFDPAGLELRQSAARWRMTMETTGYGCDSQQPAALTPSRPIADRNRVEYRREASSGDRLTEWYVNGPLGVEQGFTLDAPPRCRRDGGGGPVIQLTVSGDLTPRVRDDGSIGFEGPRGDTGLRYDKLAVEDARGQPVPARVRVDRREVSLIVDDTDAVYPLIVDPLIFTQTKLIASDPVMTDLFGDAVAMRGDRLVVGATTAHTIDENEGAVYVFERDEMGAWSEVQKLWASDGDNYDYFGYAVALSEDRVIAGAQNDGIDGSAYIFVRDEMGSWSEEQKLLPSEDWDAGDFGHSVAIEGGTAIVGDTSAKPGNKTLAGAVDVFVRDEMGVWTLQQALTADPVAAGDRLGASVALAGDLLVVGATGTGDSDTGGVFVFERDEMGVWSQQQVLSSGDISQYGNLGTSVAVSGDTIIAGAVQDNELASHAGAAIVWTRDEMGVWSQQQKLLASDGEDGDYFGRSVALEGDVAVVGAESDDDENDGAGALLVFTREGDAWTETYKLTAPGGSSLGWATALQGNTIASGQPVVEEGHGALVIFEGASANGDACDEASECDAGYCVDGVCCESECGGGVDDCQACSLARGASADGVCEPLSVDTTCRPQAGECDVAERFDGESTQCPDDALAPDGVVCEEGVCLDGACEPDGASGSDGTTGDTGTTGASDSDTDSSSGPSSGTSSGPDSGSGDSGDPANPTGEGSSGASDTDSAGGLDGPDQQGCGCQARHDERRGALALLTLAVLGLSRRRRR